MGWTPYWETGFGLVSFFELCPHLQLILIFVYAFTKGHIVHFVIPYLILYSIAEFAESLTVNGCMLIIFQ